MLKNKLFIVVIAVLFIVMVVHNLRFFSNLSDKKENIVISKNQTSILTQEKADEPLSQGKDFPEDLGSRGWGRNPFLTPEEIVSIREGKVQPRSVLREELPHQEELPLPLYKISTILVSDSRKIAIIGNTIVTVGDWVGQEKVLEINPNNVVLGKDGRKRVLNIRESSVPLIMKGKK